MSRGWTFRFCRKHFLLLQSIPEPSTPLPPALEREVATFVQILRHKVTKEGYKDTNIIAMDEVPLQILLKGVFVREYFDRWTFIFNKQYF